MGSTSMKVPDVVARLRVSRARLDELMASGELRSVRIGGSRGDGRWHGYVSMGLKAGGRRDRRHVNRRTTDQPRSTETAAGSSVDGLYVTYWACTPPLLDGDNVCHGLNKALGFTEADQVKNRLGRRHRRAQAPAPGGGRSC